jgi:arylsulfatase A-like enzyme
MLEVVDEAVLSVELDGLLPAAWGALEVKLDAEGGLRDLSASLGSTEATAAVVSDGRTHTYRLHLDGASTTPWDALELTLSGSGTGQAVVRSVSLVPRGLAYAAAPAGTVSARRDKAKIEALFAHAPSEISLPLDVPDGARLDLSLGLAEDPDPVQFSVSVEDAEGRHALLDQQWTDPDAWSTHHLDLSRWAGQSVTLHLETASPVTGAVGLWGAPVVSGHRVADRPNVIVYAIDGGGADYMSLYGYERETTPNLAALAAEGVVFERAHTTSGWTKSSTASFLTSLHHSVLGGYTTDSDAVPEAVETAAERFRSSGYQTAVFTSNPFAGSLSGLQAGVDYFRDARAKQNSASSVELHSEFLTWRTDWPAEPYWAHIQPTDVHEPHAPVPPFAGTYITPERRADFEAWWRRVHAYQGQEVDTVLGRYVDRLDRLGIDRRDFFTAQRDLYDETMLHADHQIGALVESLKERGEWERTLLVLTADHGHPAGSFSRFGRGLLVPQPEDWEGALADSYRSHVPLLVVWPGALPAGRRVDTRVSLIDLLPTLLDLSGLPAAEVRQGQSWRPLLTGEGDWRPQPVVLEQLQAHEGTGQLVGHVEMIDGRWAASLEVMPQGLVPEWRAGGESLRTAGGWRAARPHRPSTPQLLLYDYDADPLGTRSVNDAHPDVVVDFTKRLEDQWAANQVLAQQFAGAGGAVMTDEQLEALRLLGYIE